MRALFALVLLTIAGILPASAQADFPNRPVRIVVPFPAGGPTDINMRILGQKLSELWGQSVVIENRPGANTGIGAQMVAKSPADGYTLLAAMDTTLVMNPATNTPMTYDPFKDFAAITITSKNTSLLMVRASDGPQTAQELIARGKASSRKLTFGAGIITTRLAGHRFAQEAGFQVVLVPYKGSAEVVQGLLTGSVDFIVDGMASSLPLIKSGQFRRARQAQQPAAVDAARRQAAVGSRRLAEAAGNVELDRAGGAGRHAEGGHRQNPRWRGQGSRRSGGRRPAGQGRHQPRDDAARGIRRLLPRRGGALDQILPGQRNQPEQLSDPPGGTP